MLHTNHHHIEDTRQPPEPEDGEALAALRDEARAVIAKGIFAERMVSPSWISDAQGAFTQAEYDAITAAIIAGDAMAIGRLTLEATRCAIRRDAIKEAAVRLEKLELEDEADYYADQVAV